MSTQKITKAVIPVAGLGSRMLPATKGIPKELLPVVDQPLIKYIIDECATIGIQELVLVTNKEKYENENYFGNFIESSKFIKQGMQSKITGVLPEGMTITKVKQERAKGLGDAILCAKPIIGNAPFVVILPDVLIDKDKKNYASHNLGKMINRFECTGVTQVLVHRVSKKDISNYGVAYCGSVELKPGESAVISSIVEKPQWSEALSDLAIPGRFVLSNAIFDILLKTEPGFGNEIQLTDAIGTLIKTEIVEAYLLNGQLYDCGSKLGYMKAWVKYGLNHEVEGKEFFKFLKNLKLK